MWMSLDEFAVVLTLATVVLFSVAPVGPDRFTFCSRTCTKIKIEHAITHLPQSAVALTGTGDIAATPLTEINTD